MSIPTEYSRVALNVERMTDLASPAPAPAPAPASRLRGERTSLASRRKVLHIINGEHYAGAERAQDLLARRLPELGFDVTFVCLKQGRFAEARASQSTPLVTMAMGSRFDLRPVRAVARMVRDGGHCIVHTHSPRSALIGGPAAALARVPLVHHVQSPTSQDSMLTGRNWINALVERLSLSRVAAVLPVSRSLEDYSRRWGLTGRYLDVVPNGVAARGPLIERSTPQGTWTIGTVALFRPRKGLDVLLAAFARLRAAGCPVRLLAVGRFETPEYEQQIKKQVQELGIADAIDWRGFRQDVPAELATMDLFVLPSLFGEGLPFVILEAMSAGVPVISTSVEGIPEAVRDSRDGLIVPPSNPEALAGAIRRVVEGQVDWQSLRRSAHQRQACNYTDRTMAEGVAAAYESVLRIRAARRPTQ